MRALLIIMMIAFTASNAHAQTFSEWFQQKKTQNKYLLEQIAALKVYSDYLQKGYTIAKDGLGFIGDLKNGELGLHNNHFSALKKVNPKVGKYVKVAEIIALQVSIVRISQSTIRSLNKNSQLAGKELDYVSGVFKRLVSACDQQADALIAVTSNGKLQMSDDERIKRIDQIHSEVSSDYSFCQDFSRDALSLSRSKEREYNETINSRALLGIKE